MEEVIEAEVPAEAETATVEEEQLENTDEAGIANVDDLSKDQATEEITPVNSDEVVAPVEETAPVEESSPVEEPASVVESSPVVETALVEETIPAE